MGKNSDLKNIFESYYNNVLLGEAVTPTEGGTGSLDKELEALKVALNNPNITPEQKTQVETAIKAKEVSPQLPMSTSSESKPNLSPVSIGGLNIGGTPSSTSTAPQPATNKSNFVPIKTAIETANKQQTTASQPAPAASAPAYNPKEEYNKLLGRTPNRFDADSFENADQVGNAKINPKAAELKKQALAGVSNPAPQQPAPAAQPTGITIGRPEAAMEPQLGKGTDVTVKIPDTLKTPTTAQPEAAPKQPAAQTTQPKTSSGSIVDYLSQTGQKSDFASRKELATKMGIPEYKGTASQNFLMLNALKSGKTEIPTQKPQATQPSTAPAQKPKQEGMGGITGGVSKVIGSTGQGIKQATIGTKKPLGGILGGISKGLGTVGKGIKTALVGNQEEEAEEYEENCEECEKKEMSRLNKNTVQEKINISKFLKHLSEKNYSSAHKYLKAILNTKINNIVSERIDKNFK